jgi:SAM-dependent methyltransferase
MSASPASRAAPLTEPRWAENPYPDYVAEVNRSIAFSGVDQDFFTLGKARRMLDLLARRGEDPGHMRLLDIGCGVGLIHPYVAPSFRETIGVDVALDALEAARRANPGVRYRAYNGRRLPADDGSFDAAATICVMHHVPPAQWVAFVDDAWRVLRPGGLFMAFEHNPWNPLTRLAVARCPFDYDAALLSPPRLARLLREGGFADVACEFMFFTPFAARPATWIEKRLRRLPLGAQYVAVGRKPA